MRTGLVLEGGGLRGIYTAGVLDVFLEHGITFDGVIGVSQGAILASSFLSGQKGRGIRYCKDYCGDKRMMSMGSLLTTGNFINVKFSYDTQPNELDVYDYDAFGQNPSEFYVVCTNVETGEPEYIRITDLRKEMDYLRASASLPFISKLVEVNGKKYLDGGVSDSIPVERFREMGFDRIVVVQTRATDYRKEPSKMSRFGWMYRQYPKFLKAMERRSADYNYTMERIQDMARKGEIFAIAPTKIIEIGRLEKDPEKIQAQYNLGYSDAEKLIKDIKAYLAG
jgi:predicted patatin/cPLA2 family phospholipase